MKKMLAFAGNVNQVILSWSVFFEAISCRQFGQSIHMKEVFLFEFLYSLIHVGLLCGKQFVSNSPSFQSNVLLQEVLLIKKFGYYIII